MQQLSGMQQVILVALILLLIALPFVMVRSFRHRMKRAEKLDGRTHRCPYCGELFCDTSRIHLHAGVWRLFRCPACGQWFRESF